MSKNICLNPAFMALQGNINATDEHGHKGTFRFRETAWGKKYVGFGPNPKRNYVTHPLSADEQAQRAAFKAASALRSTILKNSALRRQWQTKFKEDRASGATTCVTLSGYLQSKAMNGEIDEQGNPA